MISVIDLPWVPVVREGREVRCSLRETLLRAHEITDLGSSLLPVEREALLRYLESLVAEILRGYDLEDLREELLDEIRLDTSAVEEFFDRHADLFILDDPQRPFLQEWHFSPLTEEDLAKRFQPMETLHLRVPGESSSLWGVTQESRDPGDPAVVALLLVVAWFHGKPSNADGATPYLPTSGAARKPIAGAPAGGPADTVFHLLGTSLAHTLLLNIPARWLNATSGPAWLDQDSIPDEQEWLQADCLWRATWTPNRPFLLWQEGRAVQVTRGLTRRYIPPVGDDPGQGQGEELAADQLKSRAKAVAAHNYTHATHTDTKGVSKRILAPSNLRSAEGYQRWYRDSLSDAVNSWIEETERACPPGRGLSIGFHREQGDTYGNRKISYWATFPRRELTVTGEPRLHLQAVLTHIEPLIKAISTSLGALGLHRKTASKIIKRCQAQVYIALDEPVIAAVQAAADGEVIDTCAIRADMTTRAIEAFSSSVMQQVAAPERPSAYRACAMYARKAHRATTTADKDES